MERVEQINFENINSNICTKDVNYNSSVEPPENNLTYQLFSFLFEFKLLTSPLIQLFISVINKLIEK